MRKLSVLLVISLILLLSAAPVAASSPPLDVVFEVETVIPDDGPSYGPFIAYGPAVDAGLVCPSGDVIDIFAKASGYQSNTGLNIQVIKRFTCDDGSGEFSVKLQVRIDFEGDNFNWTIVDGNGAYEKLHGTGSGVGLPAPYGVFDIYDGKLHID